MDGGSWQRGNKRLCGQPKCGHRSISSKVWLSEATSHQVINYCSNWQHKAYIAVQLTLVPNTMAFVFVLLTTQRQHAVLMVLKIHFRITEMWDYAKFGCPMKHAGKYYFFHNTGLQNQRYLRIICDLLFWSKMSLPSIQHHCCFEILRFKVFAPKTRNCDTTKQHLNYIWYWQAKCFTEMHNSIGLISLKFYLVLLLFFSGFWYRDAVTIMT